MAGDFRIEAFKNLTPDPSGHGEGEIFLSSVNITHLGAGVQSFSMIIPAVSGDAVALTATEIDTTSSNGFGSTSEFSPNAIVESLGPDFGDAPDTGAGSGTGNYNTIFSDNGAYHIIGSVYLGQCVDSDDGLSQNSDATADDILATLPSLGASCTQDEDGVVFPVLSWGAQPTLSVIVNDEFDGVDNGTASDAILDVWIDFNANGDFEDAGEHIIVSQTVTE